MSRIQVKRKALTQTDFSVYCMVVKAITKKTKERILTKTASLLYIDNNSTVCKRNLDTFPKPCTVDSYICLAKLKQ